MLHIPYEVLLGLSFVVIIATAFSFLRLTPTLTYRYRWIFGILSFLLFVFLGYFNSKWFDNRNEISVLDKENTYLVEVLSIPKESANSYSSNIRLIKHLREKKKNEKEKDVFGKAILYLEKEKEKPNFFIGDYLLVHTNFQPLHQAENPNEFNFAKYLSRQGIQAVGYASTEKWQKTNLPPKKSLKRLANLSRNYLLSIYEKYGITGSELFLLGAITLGDKDNVEMDTKDDFSRSGAAHILVISGLHIGIIYGVIMLLLKSWETTRRKKIARAIFVTLLIWVFAFITGLSPAVQRATTMMTFVAIATCFDRKSHIFNTIFVSAFVLLLFNPNLLFNIGFQLSYSAVLSIIYFQPKFQNLLTVENPFFRWAWILLTVTISAQIGIAPISIYYFHQFPNLFIITNFVTIPLTTGILYLAILLFILSPISFLAYWVAYVLKFILTIMLLSVGFIASVPFAISSIGLTGYQMIFIYVFIFAITIFINTKRGNFLIYSLFSVLLIISISVKNRFHALTHKEIIVYANSKSPMINFLQANQNIALTSNEKEMRKTANSFWLKAGYPTPTFYNFIKENQSFFSFNGKRILIISDDRFNYKTANKSIEIDYLIVTNKVKLDTKNIFNLIKPKIVIIDKSISQWYQKKIIEKCKKENINYYSINEKGAYRVEI